MKQFQIGGQQVDLSVIDHVLSGDISTLLLSDNAKTQVAKSYDYIQDKISDSDTLHYGINTGFGSLCNVAIDSADIMALQVNLVRSHACGMGDRVPEALARLMLFLKINNLSQGYSGVSPALLDTMVQLYNAGIYAHIYQLGSLGASGDLAPLAHLALSCIGEGRVDMDGLDMPAADALRIAGISAHQLQAKEGLALLNGTQFSSAYMAYATVHARRLLTLANRIATLSMEAYDCDSGFAKPYSHQIRRHSGQQRVAADLYAALTQSQIIMGDKVSVQDPYSFRCVPQVHGACLTAIDHAYDIITEEIQAVTDNPNVFAEHDEIISAGNFHAQPLAMVLDYLAIALSELGNISERRTYKLIHGDRGLPPYLTDHAGLESGFMIAQYTAASIASQNKQLCTPASVDSIVSSIGQEDHVSMAANAATKTYKVVDNLYRLLSIELMVAAKALEYRDVTKASPQSQNLYDDYRKVVSTLDRDRVLHNDMVAGEQFLREIVI